MEYKEMGITFTRKEIYDLLMSMTVTGFVKQFNLDYNCFINAINDYHIPYRSTTDWEKISTGRKIDIVQLGGNPDQKVFVSYADKVYIDPKTPMLQADIAEPYSDDSHNNDSVKQIDISPEWIESNFTNKIHKVLGIPADVEQYIDVNIKDLNLSARSGNGLLRARVNTLQDILSLTVGELYSIRNLGLLSFQEIIAVCRDYCHAHFANEPTATQQEDISEDPSLVIQLIMEFYKLNPAGQELAVKTIKGLTELERFQHGL